jgi:hypothetical protein
MNIYPTFLKAFVKGMSSETCLAESGFKVPRFSADFNYPLSYEGLFKFPHPLVGPLGIDNIIAMSDLNIHRDILKLTQTPSQQGHGQGH